MDSETQAIIIWEKGHLSLDTILQYNKRKLAPIDMHKVERHLLNCELCTEAIEGFSSVSDKGIQKNIDELKKRIGQQVSPEYAESRSNAFKYIGIAASVAILLAVSYIFIDQSANTEAGDEENLALKEAPLAEKDDLEDLDALSSQPTEFSQEDPITEEEQVESPTAGAGVSNVPDFVDAPKNDLQAETELAASAQEMEDLSGGTVSNQASLALSNEGNEGLGGAELARSAPTTVLNEAPTDEAEALDLSSSTTESEVAVATLESTPLQASTPVSLDDDFSNIEEKRSETTTRKSAATDASRDKAPSAPAEEQALASGFAVGAAKKARANMNSDPEPAIGFEGYAQYLKDELRFPEEARQNNISGTIIVEFTLKQGSVYSNFNIVEGLGAGCDQEAIRLIKEGPNWNAAVRDGVVAKEKVKVEVEF